LTHTVYFRIPNPHIVECIRVFLDFAKEGKKRGREGEGKGLTCLHDALPETDNTF